MATLGDRAGSSDEALRAAHLHDLPGRPDRPLCKCHGEPMHKSGVRTDGTQKWECRVRRSLREKRPEYRKWKRQRHRARFEADPKYREALREQGRRSYGKNWLKARARQDLYYLRVTRPKVLLDQRERVIEQLRRLDKEPGFDRAVA